MTAGRPPLFRQRIERTWVYRCRFCKEYDRPASLIFNASKTVAQHRVCANAYHRKWRKRSAG